MNFFYAPEENWDGDSNVSITDQEAQHLLKVLRNKTGDEIFVSDGLGKIYTCIITATDRHTATARILNVESKEEPRQTKVLALGLIKKRDRLEFALEKAVELGATEICLFNADHSERSNTKVDRLELIIRSAFKQSGRFWLPSLIMLKSLDEVYENYGASHKIMAHEEMDVDNKPQALSHPENLLLVGPEGGFSTREIALHQENKGSFISLGHNRLRAETAVTAFLSQYLFN